MYNIEISYALNGIICQVGCQRVVFTDIDEFLQALNKYLRDPRKTEVEWRKGDRFGTLDCAPTIAPPPPPRDELQPIVPLNSVGLGRSDVAAY